MLRVVIILASLFAVTAGAFPAAADGAYQDLAQNRDPRERYTAGEASDAVRQGDVVPAIRVITAVRRRYPDSDVLDAELEAGSPPRYVIKIMTRDGRRIDVVADARTGRILYER